jgi:hypothetical protein
MNRVQLVDEQQDASFRGPDLGQDGLEPLLELAPVLGPRDQGAHVQAEDRLVPQPLGHVTAIDPLGQALHDGGLAHAGVADQDRVVLGLAGQDLDDAPDLGVPADHRVEPAAGRVVDENLDGTHHIESSNARSRTILTFRDANDVRWIRLRGGVLKARLVRCGARRHALDAGQHLARHPGAGLFGGTCPPVFP